MKKIAVLNDLSGLGKCSLTAAIPVISVMGVQAVPFPTAVLSSQTGYTSYFYDDYTDRLDYIIEEWKKIGFAPDGIYTGFLAGEAQAEKIQEFLNVFAKENTKILTDPILGDNGKAHGFYTEKLCECMRALVRRAHVITPNLTEAMLLLIGKEETEKQWKALQEEGDKAFKSSGNIWNAPFKRIWSADSCHNRGGAYRRKTAYMGNLVCEAEENFWVFSKKEGEVTPAQVISLLPY